MNSKNIAVVTGGNRGLGFEVCSQLGKQGYRVYLTCRNEEEGENAARILHNKGMEVNYYHVDVADQATVDKFASYISNLHGHLDVLINGAAMFYDLGHQIASPDMERVEAAMQTNILGAWRMSAALLPSLKASENPRIVNVSSGAGALHNMRGDTPAYSMTKAALNVLTIKMAAEWKRDGIKVNAVCPGWVRTEMGGRLAPRSVEEGALSIMWAAELAKDGPTGGFYRDGEPIQW